MGTFLFLVPTLSLVFIHLLISTKATNNNNNNNNVTYYYNPVHDVTCGFDNECVIMCTEDYSCQNRIFTFLNDWGETKGQWNSSLLCTGDTACSNIVLVANTSSLFLNFEGYGGWYIESYINFGSNNDVLQSVYISCDGQYSCAYGSYVFNSMLDTDQASQEMETVSNGIVEFACNEYYSCRSTTITAFQVYDLNIDCLASHSCDALTVYSPLKYHIDYFDVNTNIRCDATAQNGSYDKACYDVRVFNYGGSRLLDVDCNDFECEIQLYCGFLFEYECDMFNSDDCAEECITGFGPSDNQIVMSPNQAIMDYSNANFTGKEVFIYVSSLYEKFIYFYEKSENNAWNLNASMPIIICPIDGICNIICTDIGYGGTYDHCAYGIFYGNLSNELRVRGYEADNSIWYGASDEFQWIGLYGNENVELHLEDTVGDIQIDCNGSSDSYAWNDNSHGCYKFDIYIAEPMSFYMNCLYPSTCEDTNIYSNSAGSYNEFPESMHIECSTIDSTTCRRMGFYFEDNSGCQYELGTDDGTNLYWKCEDWYSAAPTVSTTRNPDSTSSTTQTASVITVTGKSSSGGGGGNGTGVWLIPVIVVIGLLIAGVIVYLLFKKYGKPQNISIASAFGKKDAKSQGFVDLNDNIQSS